MAHTGGSRDLVFHNHITPETTILLTLVMQAKKELAITTSYHKHLVRLIRGQR